MRFERELKKLRQQEWKNLKRISFKNRAEVEIILETMGRKIWKLSRDDERRMLTFQIWATKYGVTLEYVVTTLVEHYARKFTRKKKWQRWQGLGTRVPTLTGRNAELVLKEAVQRLYPDGEQQDIQKAMRRREILQDRDEREHGVDEFPPKRKSLQDFEWPQQYVRYYKRRMRERRLEMEKALTDKQNKARAYRGNPWI